MKRIVGENVECCKLMNPQQGNLDNEMANLKNQPDKCAIAKRRKENKKAKEAKNSYVVESKDG
uniref:Uncharacterized protein n=1 Tax=Setaria digitata TaxID=48799 RepID=A0A915PL50_9BILA